LARHYHHFTLQCLIQGHNSLHCEFDHEDPIVILKQAKEWVVKKTKDLWDNKGEIIANLPSMTGDFLKDINEGSMKAMEKLVKVAWNALVNFEDTLEKAKKDVEKLFIKSIELREKADKAIKESIEKIIKALKDPKKTLKEAEIKAEAAAEFTKNKIIQPASKAWNKVAKAQRKALNEGIHAINKITDGIIDHGTMAAYSVAGGVDNIFGTNTKAVVNIAEKGYHAVNNELSKAKNGIIGLFSFKELRRRRQSGRPSENGNVFDNLIKNMAKDTGTSLLKMLKDDKEREENKQEAIEKAVEEKQKEFEVADEKVVEARKQEKIDEEKVTQGKADHENKKKRLEELKALIK